MKISVVTPQIYIQLDNYQFVFCEVSDSSESENLSKCISFNTYVLRNLADSMLGFTKSFQTIRQKSKLLLKNLRMSVILKEVIDYLFLNLFGNNETKSKKILIKDKKLYFKIFLCILMLVFFLIFLFNQALCLQKQSVLRIFILYLCS